MRFESAKRLDRQRESQPPFKPPLRSQRRMWVEESLVFAECVGSCPFTTQWPLKCTRNFASKIEDHAITNREVSQPPAAERAERSPRDGVDVGAALRSPAASQESTSGCYCAICDGARQVAVAFGRFESDTERGGVEHFLEGAGSCVNSFYSSFSDPLTKVSTFEQTGSEYLSNNGCVVSKRVGSTCE